MKEIKTIDDVIAALDAVVQDSARMKSRAGYFAALYKRMTMAVSDGIQKGAFEDCQRMEALDVLFAQRYLTAFEAFKSSTECSSSWQHALTGCNNRSLIVLQHLLLGINAHVNLDLAIAAAKLAPGKAIHALEKDFNHINVLIAELVDDVQKCLEEVWFPMRFLRDIINRQGHAVLNFSMTAAVYRIYKNSRQATDAVYYSFYAQNSKQYTGTFTIESGIYKQGDTLDIYYLPSNPKRNTMQGAWGSNFIVGFGIAIAAFVLFAVYKLYEEIQAGRM